MMPKAVWAYCITSHVSRVASAYHAEAGFLGFLRYIEPQGLSRMGEGLARYGGLICITLHA
jgi:hypothetical protein